MPLVVALIGGLVSTPVVTALLTRALVALGISLITYTGISIGMSALLSSLGSNFSALESTALALLNICHIPQALNVITSALVAALALRGLSAAGSISRVVWSGSGSAFTSSVG